MNHHYSSLCMLREAYWWIGSPRYSIISPIRQRMDWGMNHLLTLDHSSHHAGIDHLDRTQNHTKNVLCTYWEWIETIWTWSITNIIDCRVVTFTIEVPAMFLNIEFHTLFLNRHRYKRKHLHHLTIQQHRWTPDTCNNNNPEASITHGLQCGWLLLPGHT